MYIFRKIFRTGRAKKAYSKYYVISPLWLRIPKAGFIRFSVIAITATAQSAFYISFHSHSWFVLILYSSINDHRKMLAVINSKWDCIIATLRFTAPQPPVEGDLCQCSVSPSLDDKHFLLSPPHELVPAQNSQWKIFPIQVLCFKSTSSEPQCFVVVFFQCRRCCRLWFIAMLFELQMVKWPIMF